MQRILPLIAAQARPRLIGEPVSAFADEVKAALDDQPHSKLVVFPELHLFGDGNPDQQRTEVLQASAEPLDGPRVKELRQLAADLGIWLVPGSVCERGPEGQLFNTQLVLSPEGELAGYYRKIFPWRPFEPYDPGDRFTTVDLAGIGRVGLNICYDAWFPEVSRQLAWMGAEVILNVVKTTTPDRRAGTGARQGQRHREPGLRGQRQLRRPHRQGTEHHRRPGGQHPRRGRRRRPGAAAQRNWTLPPSSTSGPTAPRTSTGPGPSSATARPPSNCPSTRAGSIRPPGRPSPSTPKEPPVTTTTLTRTLKLPSLVLFGLAYLTPLIVLGIFGIIAETTGGAIAVGLPPGDGRHAVHGAQLRPDGRRLPGGRLRLHLRAPVHRPAGWASWWAGRSCWTTCSCPW